MQANVLACLANVLATVPDVPKGKQKNYSKLQLNCTIQTLVHLLNKPAKSCGYFVAILIKPADRHGTNCSVYNRNCTSHYN